MLTGSLQMYQNRHFINVTASETAGFQLSPAVLQCFDSDITQRKESVFSLDFRQNAFDAEPAALIG